jgi:thymidine phosphorylase
LSADRPSIEENTLRVRRLGIDTHQEAVVYMRADCPLCRSEGFEAQSRVEITRDGHSIVATLSIVDTDLAVADLLGRDEAGLSEIAWRRLGEPTDQSAHFAHPRPVESLSDLRSKIYGAELDEEQFRAIIGDIVDGRYADVHLAAFLTACSGEAMTATETIGLTRAMVDAGDSLRWNRRPVVDKHSVGGLPGNRTTPVVVSIVTARGLTMPKTSSRAITSPAGTADTMETLTNVELSLDDIRRVVDEVGGCIAWGGSVKLSPADDRLIRIERLLDIDSDSQLVASVLSKKAAAGSSHVVIDMPVGPTAKVRSGEAADQLEGLLETVAEAVGLTLSVVRADGRQPVGRGIGPALEARDVLAVLRGDPEAPDDLRQRAITLAGRILESADAADDGGGADLAEQTLADGDALEQFRRICRAQGGLREPPTAEHRHRVTADRAGIVTRIDNRKLARAAKLAGAPDAPAAGLEFLAPLETRVEPGQPLFVLHAETPGEMQYALEYVDQQSDIVQLEAP